MKHFKQPIAWRANVSSKSKSGSTKRKSQLCWYFPEAAKYVCTYNVYSDSSQFTIVIIVEVACLLETRSTAKTSLVPFIIEIAVSNIMACPFDTAIEFIMFYTILVSPIDCTFNLSQSSILSAASDNDTVKIKSMKMSFMKVQL